MQDVQLLTRIKVLSFVANFPKQRRVTYVSPGGRCPQRSPTGSRPHSPPQPRPRLPWRRLCRLPSRPGREPRESPQGPAGPPRPAPLPSPGVWDRGSPASSPVRNRDHHSHAEAIKHFVSSVKLGQQMAGTYHYAAVVMPTKPLKYSTSTVLFKSTITKHTVSTIQVGEISWRDMWDTPR